MVGRSIGGRRAPPRWPARCRVSDGGVEEVGARQPLRRRHLRGGHLMCGVSFLVTWLVLDEEATISTDVKRGRNHSHRCSEIVESVEAQEWAPCEPSERSVDLRRTLHMVETESCREHRVGTGAERIEGYAVTVDDSTTAVRVWPRLVERLPLTVVTDSLPAIDELAADPRVRLQAIGGDHLADVHPSGATADLELACIAGLGVLLVDHTDTTRRAVHRFCVLPHLEAVVVDDRADAGEIKRLCARGADVVVAPTPGGPRASQSPPAGESAEAQDAADADAPEP